MSDRITDDRITRPCCEYHDRATCSDFFHCCTSCPDQERSR